MCSDDKQRLVFFSNIQVIRFFISSNCNSRLVLLCFKLVVVPILYDRLITCEEVKVQFLVAYFYSS